MMPKRSPKIERGLRVRQYKRDKKKKGLLMAGSPAWTRKAGQNPKAD